MRNISKNACKFIWNALKLDLNLFLSYEEAGTYNTTTGEFEYSTQFYRVWVYKLGFALIFTVNKTNKLLSHGKSNRNRIFSSEYTYSSSWLNGSSQIKNAIWLNWTHRRNTSLIEKGSNSEKMSFWKPEILEWWQDLRMRKLHNNQM